MATKAERRLQPLPDYGQAVASWRNWLNEALAPARGHKVCAFLRHGRQRTDTCTLVLLGPDGKHLDFEIAEQRFLATPGTLRATLVAATDGLVRPGSLTKGEQEDVWIALVTLATVTAHQSTSDEARDWLETTIEEASELTGYSLTASARPDALAEIVGRNKFDYLAARRFTDPNTIDPPRPLLMVDAQTGERWIRVGDLAAFWRHVLGVGVMSQPTIDGRLSAIGVKRHPYTYKNSLGHTQRVRLYRVADGGKTK